MTLDIKVSNKLQSRGEVGESSGSGLLSKILQMIFCGVFLFALCEMFGLGAGATLAGLAGWLVTWAAWCLPLGKKRRFGAFVNFVHFMPLIVVLAADLIFHESFGKSLAGLLNCAAKSYGEHMGVIVKTLENVANATFAAVTVAVLVTTVQGIFCALESKAFSFVMLGIFSGLLFGFGGDSVMVAALVYVFGILALFVGNARSLRNAFGRLLSGAIALAVCFALDITGALGALENAISEDKFDSSARYEVIMEKPAPLYLIESRFEVENAESFAWEKLSNAEKFAFADSFYWLYSSGFYPELQASDLNKAIGVDESEAERQSVTINIKNGKKAIYPYGITSAEGVVTDEKKIDGGLENSANWYKLAVPGNYLSKPSGSFAALQRGGDEVESYLDVEKGYRDYVYKTCLGLSSADRQMIASHFDLGGSVGKLESQMLSFFAGNCTLDKGLSYGGEGSLGRLLERELKGGEEDFAAAAVKIFRAKGVPARLCRGYLVTDDMTDGLAENSAIEVTAENLHYWAEYYKDGIGWQPFEVIPEYVGLIDTDDEAVKAAKTGKTGGESLAPRDEEITRQEIFEENNDTDKSEIWLKKVVIIIVAGLLALAILAAVVAILACKIARKRLMKKPADKRVKVIFTAAVKKLCGKDISNLTPFERGKDIEKRFGKGMRDKFEAAEEVFEKAAFSRLDISEQEEQSVFDFEQAAKNAKNVRM
ncbi:transglutaminase family protein [Ruminococcus sp.]|uniref:transglutaminase-like domain-containing protein n=1 Tax=Ruminococcus sp. TaxID=41978 RepID=UPI0025DF226C|nr:transglutaminase domain-containing protein [Ruminococcus sp.]